MARELLKTSSVAAGELGVQQEPHDALVEERESDFETVGQPKRFPVRPKP
jgi:hypothetical protein